MPSKEFISIKKAALFTGKSEQKIIKLWENYRQTKLVKKRGKKRYVSLSLLQKKYNLLDFSPIVSTETITTTTNPPEDNIPSTEPIHPTPENQLLIEILKDQLLEKDRQLLSKDSQIAQLIERTREQNNIIFALEQHQQQLESKLTVSLPQVKQTEVHTTPIDKAEVNYLYLALVILLVGVLLIIFYIMLSN